MIAFLLFLGLQAQAIEYEFDGGRVTAVGGLTDQPAALGYLNQKYTFAASASALEFKKFNIQNNAFEQDSSPMSFKPVFVGSAMSTSYGGWSFLIYNTEDEYRAALTTASGGVTTDSTVSLRLKSFTALVSSGFRIHENWSLGWGLVLGQSQVQNNTETSNTGGGNDSLVVVDSVSQTTTGNFNMGTLLTLDEFVLGLKVSTPSTLLTRSGKKRTRTLLSPNNFTDIVQKENLSVSSDWNIDAGVRFGRSGFSYSLADQYSSNGLHILSFGFDYVGSWGSLASGFSHSEFKKTENSSLTIGFVKDHKNFKWGVGPFYRESSDATPGAINSTSFGVMYSSEIRY